jgi:4-hydroxy-tetrahydrodipicolinate synthase
MHAEDLAGIIPAVIVPMRDDYTIEFDAFRRYLEWIVSLGPVAVAVNVDTGEGAYLSSEERTQVIQVTKDVAARRCKVIAGCGGPATSAAVANACLARDAGADGLLVFPTPAFLNEPLDPRICYEYHEAIATASGLPIVLFQLGPIFGGVNYPPDALHTMMGLPQVIGIKDASFDLNRFCLVRDIVNAQSRKIALLTGNDNFLLESFLLGADGGLLGYGAVGTELLIEQLNAVRQHDFVRANRLKPRVQGFCDYIYGRPIGDYRARCKVSLVHMGLLKPEETYVRPPYASLWAKERHHAADIVQRFGLRVVGDAL